MLLTSNSGLSTSAILHSLLLMTLCHYKGRAGKRLCSIVKIVVDLVSWILEDTIYLCVKFRLYLV